MTFDTIRLDKGLYTSDKGFTKSLEDIDPSENYKGTELEGLDAYERQLKRFDIKVKGKNSDTISKFFQTTDSAVLFPEYIRRTVAAAVANGNELDEIVATTTVVDSLDYRSVECQPIESDNYSDGFINEGTHIPELSINIRNNLTKLKKSGRCLVASYEAIKSQKIDLFSVMLRQIGDYIKGCQMAQAVNVLYYAGAIVDASVRNNIAYTDFTQLFTKLYPYQLNTIIAETDVFLRIISMNEFRDGTAGLDFHGTGKLITPLGAKLIHAKTSILKGAIVGFDKNYTLEKVQFGDIVTDFDKLIDRQIERATVTSTAGFNIIVDSAAAFLRPKN